MKHVSLARMMWVVSLALPAAVAAAPGDARACGSAVYLARPRRPPPVAQKPVEVPTPVEVAPAAPASKPAEIIPPFPAPKHIEIIPPFPAPKPKPQPVVDQPQLVADAEQALSEGKPGRAAAWVAAAFPGLRHAVPGTLTLADRALRVLALASVRTDGHLDVGGMKGRTAGDRTANVEWAAEVLGRLNERRANNPAYQTDLGEALAKVPARRSDAERLLGELADRDLVTSAEGYAALARLRAQTGDEASRDALRKRCEVMTLTPAICAPPEAGRS